jgi:(2Fe-2S) ferredoxin
MASIMSNPQHKLIRPLTGYFLGWGDDRTPHRYIRLGTDDRGELLVKVAKQLRSHIQDWQPGMLVNLLTQEKIDRVTGCRKIKVKQLFVTPSIDRSVDLIFDSIVSTPVAPTKIQVCQGSSCRRRGSEKICQMMQSHLERNDLTETVRIESVKCLHQCKAAPQAIVTSPNTAAIPGKTHYRQLQPIQVQALLAKHFPIANKSEPLGSNIAEKIDNYFQQWSISTAAVSSQL